MDTVVYETKNKPIYVIQFQENDGGWHDSTAPKFNSKAAAINYLGVITAATYAYRIVERI
jgi:hypothetical protein